ncbi:MarR family winged helix-turn-helix transcriptional regulator [Marinicrinis lubricantis]|uniref:MarR family winged helix-turn-helix transcriptional regulator n=1 Tax=Marinicrinis lubricantis TaxID=2086470 RepID=A0ABW1IKL1_9BACL
MTTVPPKQPQAAEIIQMLLRTTHFVQQAYENQLSALELPFHLSGPRLRLLLTVWQAEQIRMNELAHKLGIKPRTVTDFVDALERDGLIVRRPDPEDRRATLLLLTDTAKCQMEKVKAIQQDISEKLLAHLPASQREQLYELLTHIVQDHDFDFVC